MGVGTGSDPDQRIWCSFVSYPSLKGVGLQGLNGLYLRVETPGFYALVYNASARVNSVSYILHHTTYAD